MPDSAEAENTPIDTPKMPRFQANTCARMRLHTPFDLIAYARERNILTEAFSPFGHGEVLDSVEIAELAEK